ncbi:MAG TPA: hypothetical protein VF762_18005, partial [Blastocatellia bacterium]
IGRREGLKNLWDNLPCGFDSHHPHSKAAGGERLSVASDHTRIHYRPPKNDYRLLTHEEIRNQL